MKFKSNFFHDIEKLNDLWNFEIFFFYKTAIDFARKENHREIVDLLSKGPIKAKP